MATKDEAKDALLDAIKQCATGANNTSTARMARDFAEAYAYLVSPAQPHGGTMTVQGGRS